LVLLPQFGGSILQLASSGNLGLQSSDNDKQSSSVFMKIMEGMEDLAAQAHFNAKELAKLCKLSVRQLQRDFRRQKDCTPQSWLNGQRLMVAQKMLQSGEPVKNVALNLGFKQSSHFCRQFKMHHNVTPAKFAGLCMTCQ
jgi:transcriptional regulator GlxA family with amidase domain